MKAYELVNILCEKDCAAAEGTVDKFKLGDIGVELSRVALCFIATPKIINEAHSWGAELLITHEPTFYDHWDVMPGYKFAKMKKELLEQTGMTLFRYHDHPHFSDSEDDLFSDAFIDAMGWKGRKNGPLGFILNEGIPPREMVRQMEKRLDVHHVRIAGELDRPARNIALLLGARGGEWNEFLASDETEVAIGGEVCEWAICEGARDATQLGIPKSAIVMGHAASERDGMKYIARLMMDRFADSGIEFRYFESGETFENL